MRKIFTLLFVGLAAFSASAQQVVKTFPSAKQSKSGAPLLAAPAQTPSSIDDKALGTKIFATQLIDESKLRSWLYFYDKNPYNLNRLNIFDNEQGWQLNGILLGAWGGDNYYCYYGKMNNLDNQMQWRGFKSFRTLDVNTGQLSEPIWDMTLGATDTNSGLVVWDYGSGSEFNNLLDMTYDPTSDLLYASEAYQKDANSDAVTILYSVDKTTGQLSKVNTIEDQIQYFCFDMDGNMWAISPYWKETGKDEKGNSVFTFSGNYLTEYDSNFEPVDGMRFVLKDQYKNNIFATSYGSLGFNHSTGELYFTARVANSATDQPYDKLMKIDPNTGKVLESNTFTSGNLIIGMYIPYYTADAREAAARVSDLKATPNANGEMNTVLSWTNPSKAWNGEDLSELAEVKIYRKNADFTRCALSSEEIYAHSTEVGTVAATAENIGKAMTWTDTNPAEGINTYYVVPCRKSGEKGVPDSIRCAVGLDIPSVPTNFTATMSGENVQLTWETPVDGKNNGYINQADLKYDIVRNPGDVKVASDVTGTSFIDESVAKVKRGKFTYTIVAKNSKGSSDAVDSKAIEAGLAPMVPVSYPINSEETAGQWTVFEKNGDGDVWQWHSWKSCYSVTTASGAGEDWTISPAVYLEKGKTYLFTSKFHNNYAGTGHTLSRYVGTAPTLEGMTTLIGQEKEYSSELGGDATAAVTYEDKFTAPADGNYYFGFCAHENTGYDVLDFYGVEVEGVYTHDLKAVELVTIGDDVASGDINLCNVTIKNNGMEEVPAKSYKIEIVQKMEDGDLVVGTLEDTPLIRVESSADVQVKFSPVEEGDYEFAFRTIYDKDECAGNNVSEYKKLKVMPFGESTPWTMIVTDDDEWESSYFPFTYTDSDDGSQSIYTKADFAANNAGSNIIERIGYEYTGNISDALQVENVTVWMAPTELNSFSDGVTDWVEESTMTKVFNGNITLYPGKGNLLSLQLDTPYEMDPTKNLVICVEHQGAVTSGFPCTWRVFNNSGARTRSIRYWAPKASAKYTEKDAAVLFVGFRPERTGISEINNSTVADVYYNAETGKLVLNGSAANVFDLSGKLLRSFNGGKEATLSLPAGMYIIKVRTADGSVQSVKLNINK